MIVRELLTKLGFTVDEAGAKKYEARISRVKEHASTLANNLGGLLGGIGLGLVANHISDVTSRFADLNSRLENFVGADKADALFTRLREVAFLTYQDVEQVTEGFLQMYQSLKNLMTADEAVTFMTSLSDAMTTYGVKGERAARAQMWINRALDMGVMNAETWNGINESAGDILDALAQSLGKNRAELMKMRDAGEITAEVLTNFFLKKAPEYRKQSEQMAVTIGDSFARIRNKIDEFIYVQDKATGASSAIAQYLLVIADHVDILAGAIALLLIPAMMGIVVWIWSTVAAFAGLAIAAAPWLILGAAIAAVVAGLVLVFQDLWSYFTGSESVTGILVSKVSAGFDSLLERAKTFFGDIVAGFLRIPEEAAQAWEELKAAFAAAMETLKTNLTSAFSSAIEGIKSMWSGFISWAAEKAGSLIPDWIKNRISGGGEKVEARASGGPIRSGSPYLVGEEGPEIVTPAHAGNVMPNWATRMLGGVSPGAMGGINVGGINLGGVNINVPQGTTQEQAASIASQVSREIDTALRKTFAGTLANFPRTA